ncbi:MAG TPA: ribonuclease J [Candidatus Polarisedimenticolaceae bacterium]|nr:ribonuclease J [Candidatus Polarisedimenticolaceae bacterium]
MEENQPKPAAAGEPPSGASRSNGSPKPDAGRPAAKPNRGSGSGGGGRRRRQPQGGATLKPLNGPIVPVNKSVFNGAGGIQATQVKDRKANQVTREPKIRVIPLGGLGEVGKNMMAIEYDNDMIMVDMGFAFPDELQPGIDYIIPDTTYVEKNINKLRGIVITHGHMDHIGAAGYVLPKFHVPIFGTRLSLAMVEKQIEEFKLRAAPDFRVLDPDKHERIQLGAAFNIELVRVTHSIPDAAAVVIRTPVGTLIHTGDWRLDPDPIDGKQMDLTRFEEIGKEKVLLLMSDSTAVERLGSTPTEKQIETTFDEIMNRAGGRVIISTFSSSLTRVQLIINSTHKAGRKLAFIGRSMLANVELAVKLGYIKVPPGLITRVQDTARNTDDQTVILCTGSQGEVNSALSRMSTGDHPTVKIKPGDTVVLSSNPIPGNEKAVVNSVDALLREGARVYQHVYRELDDIGILHVSGHAPQDDLAHLIKLVKPTYFMPLHGEFHMLVRHAELAVKAGVIAANTFVMDNGDVLEITGGGAKKVERVPSGIVLIDGSGVGDVENLVLRDRLALGSDGMVVVIATVDRKSGRLLTSPDIISRGFVHMKENEELIGRMRQEIRKSFERRNKTRAVDWGKFKMSLRDDIADFLYAKTKRNPMILPVVNEVDAK